MTDIPPVAFEEEPEGQDPQPQGPEPTAPPVGPPANPQFLPTPKLVLTKQDPQQQQQPPRNPIAEAGARERARMDIRLYAAFNQAVQSDPDLAAEAQMAAKQLGVDALTAEQHMPTVRRLLAQRHLNVLQISENNPVLQTLMANPEFASVARDEVAPLMLRERLTNALSYGEMQTRMGMLAMQVMQNRDPNSAWRQIFDLREQMAGMRRPAGWVEGPFELVGQMMPYIPEALAAGSTVGFAFARAASTKSGPFAHKTTPAAFALGFGLGSAPVLFTRMRAIEGGHIYLELLDRGVDPYLARNLGLLGGTASASVELWGLNLLARPFRNSILREFGNSILPQIAQSKRGEAWRRLGTDVMKAVGGNLVEEVAQEHIQFGAELLGQAMTEGREFPPVSFEEYQDRMGEIAKRTIQGVWLLAIPGPAYGFWRDSQMVKQSEQYAKVIDSLYDAAQEGKLPERSPDKFAQFMQSTMEENAVAKDVFIEASKIDTVLFEMGKTREELFEIVPELKETLPAAAAIGEDVVIPIGDFAAKLARSDYGLPLKPHIRLSERSYSQEVLAQKISERDAMAEQIVQEMAESADRVDRQESEGRTVFENRRKELSAAPQYDEEMSRLGAAFHRQMMQRIADRLNAQGADVTILDVDEMYRNRFRPARSQLAGQEEGVFVTAPFVTEEQLNVKIGEGIYTIPDFRTEASIAESTRMDPATLSAQRSLPMGWDFMAWRTMSQEEGQEVAGEPTLVGQNLFTGEFREFTTDELDELATKRRDRSFRAQELGDYRTRLSEMAPPALGQVLGQHGLGLGVYSELVRKIEADLPDVKMSRDEWVQKLEELVRGDDALTKELAWSGLIPWLESDLPLAPHQKVERFQVKRIDGQRRDDPTVDPDRPLEIFGEQPVEPAPAEYPPDPFADPQPPAEPLPDEIGRDLVLWWLENDGIQLFRVIKADKPAPLFQMLDPVVTGEFRELPLSETQLNQREADKHALESWHQRRETAVERAREQILEERELESRRMVPGEGPPLPVSQEISETDLERELPYTFRKDRQPKLAERKRWRLRRVRLNKPSVVMADDSRTFVTHHYRPTLVTPDPADPIEFDVVAELKRMRSRGSQHEVTNPYVDEPVEEVGDTFVRLYLDYGDGRTLGIDNYDWEAKVGTMQGMNWSRVRDILEGRNMADEWAQLAQDIINGEIVRNHLPASRTKFSRYEGFKPITNYQEQLFAFPKQPPGAAQSVELLQKFFDPIRALRSEQANLEAERDDILEPVAQALDIRLGEVRPEMLMEEVPVAEGEPLQPRVRLLEIDARLAELPDEIRMAERKYNKALERQREDFYVDQHYDELNNIGHIRFGEGRHPFYETADRDLKTLDPMQRIPVLLEMQSDLSQAGLRPGTSRGREFGVGVPFMPMVSRQEKILEFMTRRFMQAMVEQGYDEFILNNGRANARNWGYRRKVGSITYDYVDKRLVILDEHDGGWYDNQNVFENVSIKQIKGAFGNYPERAKEIVQFFKENDPREEGKKQYAPKLVEKDGAPRWVIVDEEGNVYQGRTGTNPDIWWYDDSYGETDAKEYIKREFGSQREAVMKFDRDSQFYWGGEFLLTRYDSALPKIIKKVVKELGGEPPQWIEMGREFESRIAFTNEFHSDPLQNTEKFLHVKINDAMKEGIAKGTPILFQGERRGTYDPKRMETLLYEKGDFSTLIHESAHHYTNILLDLVRTNIAPDDIKADVDAMLKWFGFDSLEAFDKLSFEEQEKNWEQFSYRMEVWFHDGTAPSVEIEHIFSRISEWMRGIYHDIHSQLGASYRDRFGEELPLLSPEVKRVMENMLASEDEIQEAEAVRELVPQFQDQETFTQLGGTLAEWTAYQEIVAQARRESVDQLTREKMKLNAWYTRARKGYIRELQNKAKEERRIVKESVEEEVKNLPVYRAFRFLRHGEVVEPDGTIRVLKEDHKLDLDTVKRIIPNDWRKLGVGRNQVSKKDGIPPDVVAEMFDYESGESMLRDMVEAPKLDEEIEARTTARMLAEHGALFSEDQLEAMVSEAVHNEARGRQVAMELRVMRRSQQPLHLMIKAAKEAARRSTRIKQVKMLRPGMHSVANRRAEKKTQEHMLAGEVPEALAAKSQAVAQHYMAREVAEAKREVEKALRGFRKIFKSDRKVAKTRMLDMVKVARVILGNYGITTKSTEDPDLMMQHVREFNPGLYAEVLPILRASQQEGVDYRELSVDDFRKMRDVVNGLWHNARQIRMSEIEGRQLDKQKIKEELVEHIVGMGDFGKKPGTGQTATWTEKIVKSISGLTAQVRRAEHWVEAMDGNNPNKPFERYLFRPARQKYVEYQKDRLKFVERFRDALRDLDFNEKEAWEAIEATELRFKFKNKAELLVAIMHSGNQSNMGKLLLGREMIPPAKLDNFDDRPWWAFINRMIEKKVLDKRHFDFVQLVWDFNEELRPMAQKVHRRMYGFPFKEVPPRPFTLVFGGVPVVYQGGYVPARTDPVQTPDANRFRLDEQLEADFRQSIASTGEGFTKERVEEYVEPLTLDMSLVEKHIDEALRFIHLQPVVRDTAILLKDRELHTAIDRVAPAAIDGILMPFLQRTARNSTSKPGTSPETDAFWNEVRINSGLSLMAGNLRNSLQQLVGWFPAMLKVRPKFLFPALTKYIRHPWRTGTEVADASDYMEQRLKGQIYDVRDQVQELVVKPSLWQKAKTIRNRHGYILQQFFQNMVDISTWKGAYAQAMAEMGETKDNKAAHEEAVARADNAVRTTQGSVEAPDVAPFEAGPAFRKIFTQFTGYWNMMANLNATKYVTTLRQMGWRGGAPELFYVWFMGFMAPVLIAEAITQSLGRGFLEDEDDNDSIADELWLDWFLAGQVKGALAMVPGFGPGLVTFFQGYDDNIIASPAIETLKSAIRGAPPAP